MFGSKKTPKPVPRPRIVFVEPPEAEEADYPYGKPVEVKR